MHRREISLLVCSLLQGNFIVIDAESYKHVKIVHKNDCGDCIYAYIHSF